VRRDQSTAGRKAWRRSETSTEQAQAYWQETSSSWLILLWFVVGGPLVLHCQLNRIVIFGFPLSYWFAGQGSLAIFIVLIVWYAVKMNQLDRKYGIQEEGV
jgi:putative solute:sodium symporter small subunit